MEEKIKISNRVKAIKHLGQNFLTSKKIASEIVRSSDLKLDDVVLEVGPGKGILTEAILEKIPQGKLIAVEKDKRLVEFLKQKFSNQKNLSIIYGDILKIDIWDLFRNLKLEIRNYKIIANIPYYITSHFLRVFLQSNFSPAKMVLMVQKEVAERIVAPSTSLRAGKESILSISVKVYGRPKIIKKVPARYFFPKPKVDSAILLIEKISKDFFKHKNEEQFFGLVKQGFSSKRKMLKNNLKLSDTECSALTKCGIKEKARAEDLSLKDWKCLYEKIFT